MNNYQIVVVIFLILMTIRFLLNFPKYLFLKKVLRKQDIFVKSNFKDSTESDVDRGKKAVEWLEENQIEIERTVLNTGLLNQSKSYMAPMGSGYVQSKKIPVLSNLTYYDSEIQEAARAMLNRSKGHYKRQSINCFNPLFWIEFVIFLPREILYYFSVSKENKIGNTVINIIQVLYWILSILLMYLQNTK